MLSDFDMGFGFIGTSKPLVMLKRLAVFVKPDYKFSSDQLEDALRDFRPPKFEVDWEAKNANSRSLQYRLNAWAYFSPLLFIATQLGQNEDYARLLRENVFSWSLDWIKQHRFNPQDPTGSNLNNGFAWYDMATGLRAAVVGHLIDLCNNDLLAPSDDALSFLNCSAQDHLMYLRDESLFTAHSNHGLYQSMGLFCLSVTAPDISDNSKRDRQLAVKRILDYLDMAVSPDGVHLEHSPIYHSFMLKALRSIAPILDLDFEGEKQILKLFNEMQDAQAAMFTPSGLLAPFGDSRLMASRDLGSIDSRIIEGFTPKLSYAVTGKPESAIPKNEPYVSTLAGFASYKHSSSKPETNGEEDEGTELHFQTHYFATAAWHHSTVHKQVDDGTCVWFENDVPIFTDPGRFAYEGSTYPQSKLRAEGYFYSNPNRIFVESAQAHCTVEIDGKSDNRRNAVPYGSGIVCGGCDQIGSFVTEMDIIREPMLNHKRLQIYIPGKALITIDEMNDCLNEKERSYTQWWQFFPAWDLNIIESRNNGLMTRATFRKNTRLAPASSNNQTKLNETSSDTVEDSDDINRYVERTYSEPDYSITSQFAAFDTTARTRIPVTAEKYLAHGAHGDRMIGWTSLYPGEILPAPALALSVEKRHIPTTLIAVHTLGDKKEEPTQAQITMKTVLGGFTEISWEATGAEQAAGRLRFLRSPESLELCVNNGPKQTYKRTFTRQHQAARALMLARAAIKNNSPNSEIFELFDQATINDAEGAFKEYAKFAKKIGDKERYIKVTEKNALTGSGDGALRFALALMEDKKNTNWLRVIKLLEHSAATGVRIGNYHLGMIYEDKLNPHHDEELAIDAYKLAAQRGHSGSMMKLANFSAKKKNADEEVKWLKRAAALNNRTARMRVADYFNSKHFDGYNPEFALENYEAVAKTGSRTAAYKAARIYGDESLSLYNPEQELHYLKQASDAGSVVASSHLARKLMQNNSEKK